MRLLVNRAQKLPSLGVDKTDASQVETQFLRTTHRFQGMPSVADYFDPRPGDFSFELHRERPWTVVDCNSQHLHLGDFY